MAEGLVLQYFGRFAVDIDTLIRRYFAKQELLPDLLKVLPFLFDPFTPRIDRRSRFSPGRFRINIFDANQ